MADRRASGALRSLVIVEEMADAESLNNMRATTVCFSPGLLDRESQTKLRALPMSVFHCPHCDQPVDATAPRAGAARVRCPACGESFRLPTPWEADDDPEVRPRRRRSAEQPKSYRKLIFGLLGGCGVLVLLCGGGLVWLVVHFLSPTSYPEQTEDYPEARSHFQTQLVRQGPAPQPWQREVPPHGVEEVEYVSGTLHLKAWVSVPQRVQRKQPAVLFLHGGFSFAAEDWDQAQPFRSAGYITMTPLLRGENGLPGVYSMFYHEVDDVLAAAEVLADRPDVDGQRLYVAGHSAGGTLALLAAMTSKRFRAAGSFSGSPDQVAWARGQENLVPFNPSDQREFQMRSPLAFPRSFKCPVRLYYGNQEILFARSSQKTAELAGKTGLDVQAVSVTGDHFTAVPEAMRRCIAFFQEH